MKAAMLDSTVLSYLVDAMEQGHRPSEKDRLDPEKVGALRLFLWDELAVGRTAIAQARPTPDPDHVKRLTERIGTLLSVFELAEEMIPTVIERVGTLGALHGDLADCRIVAEAEAFGAEAVVTFGERMRTRLQDATSVEIQLPTERWEVLAIPRGTPPRSKPHETNWLNAESFWRWE